MAERDLIVGVGDRLTGGSAGAIEGVRWDLFRELGEEAHFAGDVRDERRWDDLPEDHLIHLRAFQVGSLEQLTGHVAGQVHGARVLERGARLAKRRATPGDDRDPPSVSFRHYIPLRTSTRPERARSARARPVGRTTPERGTKPTTGPADRPRAVVTTEPESSPRTRAAALRAMAAEPVDLLVIGGGITGAGVARDAALRGIRTALVDKGDFASGTSSHSSRLIHGGLRYLEQYEFHLVREASRERRVLLKVAPHLVRPLPFVLPAYRGARVPAWRLRAGLWLYDLLAGFRNVGLHRWLGRKATLRLEPGLRDKDLRGAAVYFDAQTDDARLTLATMRAAAQAGALVASHADVTALLKPDGRIRGAAVRDMLSGDEYSVRALVVVNATGPWVDQVRRLEDPAAEPLLRLTRGAHVAVPRQRMGHVRAMTLTSPLDGRVMFILPWGDLSYIGTTDTDDDTSPDDVRASGEDAVYLLRSANWFFPTARLSP